MILLHVQDRHNKVLINHCKASKVRSKYSLNPHNIHLMIVCNANFPIFHLLLLHNYHHNRIIHKREKDNPLQFFYRYFNNLLVRLNYKIINIEKFIYILYYFSIICSNFSKIKKNTFMRTLKLSVLKLGID